MYKKLLSILANKKILTLLLTCGFFTTLSAQTITFDGSTDATWNTAANWDLNRVPLVTDDVEIPTGKNVTVNTAAVCKSFKIKTGTTANTIAIGGNSLTVTNAVTIEAPSATLGTTKEITISTGTLSCGSISMTNANPLQTSQIKVTGAGTVTVTGNGNIVMAGSGSLYNIIDINTGGTLNIGGSITGGALTASGNSTVNFYGSAAQTIPVSLYNFNNVKINNTAGATLDGTVTSSYITGDLNVQTGTLSTAYALAGGGTKTFTVGSGATFITSYVSTSAFATGFGTYALHANSTVQYTGAGNQTVYDVPSPGYGHLIIGGASGTKTAATDGLSVQGNVTVNSGPTFALVNFTHAIAGNFTNSGTVTATAGGTINLTGNWSNIGTFTGGASTIANITGTLTNSGTFSGITTANMASGALTNSGTFTGPTSGNLTVTGALTNSGTFSTPTSGTLTVTGNLSNSGTTFTGATTGTMNLSGNLSNTGGTFTAGTTSTINLTGNFTNSATFTAGTSTSNLNVGGSWDNTGGTFNAGTAGKVTFTGTSTGKTISGNLSGTSKFYNLTFNGVGGGWTIGSSLTVANTLAVTNGAVTMGSGVLTLEANAALPVLGGTLTLDNSAGLFQPNFTGNNLGSIAVNRNTTNIVLDDYTYWSSPTTGSQTLLNFSPYTQLDKFFKFDNSGWVYAPTTSTFTSGIGYCLRSPEGIDPSAPAFVAHTFTGVPTNGIITVPPTYSIGAGQPKSYKLIGNPYPSALDANAFINANKSVGGSLSTTITGTLYFWTHNHGLTQDNGSNYDSNDYAIYTTLGGTRVGAAGTGNNTLPNGYIASGQGFFVETTTDTGNITFNNTMRTSGANDNSNFYKSSTGKNADGDLEVHRIWLNLTNNTSTNFSQALVGYMETATNDYDPGIDGLCFGTNQFVLYSLIGDEQYAIQGRALPFADTDIIQFGYKINVVGDATISIDQIDGLFLAGQNIYLEDKLLNVTHNLKLSPYTFASEVGTFNDRFLLRYVDTALGLETYDELSNNVTVTSKNHNIMIKSKTEPIKEVIVYDILGRQIYENKKVSGNEVLITDLTINQALIIKIILSNGQSVNKKLVY